MKRSIRWAAKTAHALAGHIARLRDTLDLLGDRLREAVARAVSQSVAGAAQDAVHSLLTEAPVAYAPPYNQSSFSHPSARWWADHADEERAAWRDEH